MEIEEIKYVIAVRKDLNMRKGKLAAQVAHAATLYHEYIHSLYLENFGNQYTNSFIDYQVSFKFKIHDKWMRTGYTKIVCSVSSEEELLSLIEEAKNNDIPVHPVYDFGLTEFHGETTLTCSGFGPWESSELDKVTGKLTLI